MFRVVNRRWNRRFRLAAPLLSFGESALGSARARMQITPTDSEIGGLAVPALGALAIEPVFLMSDSAIVGHLGTAQLAGLGVGSGILLNLVNLCLFLSFAAMASIARKAGSGDAAAAAAGSVDAMWLAVGIGVGLAVLLGALSDPLTSLFGSSPSALGYSRTYLDISLAGVPGMLLVLAATGILRGFGDSWTPLWITIGSGVLNIGLNWTLVYGLHMGISGSAAGTAAAQTLTAASIVWLVARRLRPHGVRWRPRIAGVAAIGAGSFALFVRTLTLRVALLAMTYVATRQGVVALASHQSCLTISGLFQIPAGALGIAAQVAVGRALGASQARHAREVIARSVYWGLASGVVLAILLAAARPAFGPLFSHDTAVRHQIAAVLLVLALQQPVGGVLFVLDGVFMGAGDGRFLAVSGVGTLLAFTPILILILVLHGTLVDLWIGLGAYLVFRLAVLLARLRSDSWLVLGSS
jgi:putative MATE family efflux protein